MANFIKYRDFIITGEYDFDTEKVMYRYILQNTRLNVTSETYDLEIIDELYLNHEFIKGEYTSNCNFPYIEIYRSGELIYNRLIETLDYVKNKEIFEKFVEYSESNLKFKQCLQQIRSVNRNFVITCIHYGGNEITVKLGE